VPKGNADPPRLALGAHGAVSSADAAASDVGIDVLQSGGNAIDAAVAVAFVLAVTHPSAGNIGGGGFLVAQLADGRRSAIDFREKAPAAASRDMYLDARGRPTDASLVGPKAAGIPGSVAGLALAHARFGSRPWRSLLLPAVRLAREGVVLDAFHADDLRRAHASMSKAGFAHAAGRYLDARGKLLGEGDRLVQRDLAATLQAIADGGAAAFYRGPIAERLAKGVRAAGGIWRVEDLANYRPVERVPVVFDYRGHTIVSMPPPSAGGVVLRQILGASELLDMQRHAWHSPAEAHLYLEATRRAYADRNMLLADPDFVTIPLGQLLSTSYLRKRMGDVKHDRATPSREVRAGVEPPRESPETTHLSVIDAAGNALALTTTLNTGFGCKFVVPGTGVLLNNEMDDFSVKPGSANVYGLVQNEQNRIEPGKRMLSSMTPTIVLRAGEVRAVVGSPGGPTITTTVAQIVRALIDYGQPLERAVAAPRLHHQWLPDAVIAERSLPPELEAGLKARGHRIIKRSPFGHANCIEVDRDSRGFRAVADVARDGGKAAAY
jgi:gamma-glutamyltranspeptidase/glutathione hydrolase